MNQDRLRWTGNATSLSDFSSPLPSPSLFFPSLIPRCLFSSFPHLPIHLSIPHLSKHPLIRLPILPFIYPSSHPSVHPSTHILVYLPIPTSIHPSTHPHLPGLVPILPSIHHSSIISRVLKVSSNYYSGKSLSVPQKNFHHRDLWGWMLLWHLVIKSSCWGLLGGSVVKNLPANAGNMGSILDRRRFQILWSN